jgi:hypothetical protein
VSLLEGSPGESQIEWEMASACPKIHVRMRKGCGQFATSESCAQTCLISLDFSPNSPPQPQVFLPTAVITDHGDPTEENQRRGPAGRVRRKEERLHTKNETAGLKEGSGAGPHPRHCFEEVRWKRCRTRKEGRAERVAREGGRGRR